MGAFRPGASGDPRKPNEIKKFDRPVSSPDPPPPDAMLLVSLVLSMLALAMKMKWASWASLLCIFSSLANASNEQMDYKQMFSAITFAIMGIFNNYVVNQKGGSPFGVGH